MYIYYNLCTQHMAQIGFARVSTKDQDDFRSGLKQYALISPLEVFDPVITLPILFLLFILFFFRIFFHLRIVPGLLCFR